MVNSIRKRRKITGHQTTRDEGGTQSTMDLDLKLDRMAWINFHKQERQMKTAKGSKKSMKEVRDAWNTLSMDEKSKFKMPKEDIVDDKVTLEKAAHEDNKVPPFDTRCTPAQQMSTVQVQLYYIDNRLCFCISNAVQCPVDVFQELIHSTYNEQPIKVRIHTLTTLRASHAAKEAISKNSFQPTAFVFEYIALTHSLFCNPNFSTMLTHWIKLIFGHKIHHATAKRTSEVGILYVCLNISL
ncbi:hypothetical protein LWI29_011375 [Acer saccharum]|uniref:Uncharacterized protein n=1 Tax=Acer saccharum TaxID=4024 RepID=A0AA39RVR3_ACESA|nr:hypothetical protein LWI29_011375 [Acer saccharum]